FSLSFSFLPAPPITTLFPYTTLFRSGRVVSESAPFMYTMGTSLGAMPTGYLSSSTTLAVALYALSRENFHTNEAYATACVLIIRSEEHTSELQSRFDLVCRLLLEIKK